MTPLERAFRSFLFSMPPQQLDELLKYIQDARQRDDTQILFKNETPTTDVNRVLGGDHDSPFAPSSNSRSVTSRAKRVHDGKRRPLNSFIAFRSFYSVIFPDLTQKAKSGILRFLWQNDPFKAKWTIIAKAYSTIRDDHDNGVSLESFLSLNASLIGVIEPDRYLDVMGWEMNVNGEQQYTMVRVKSSTATDANRSTNYSVNDIVKNCYATGYVSENKRKNKQVQKTAPVMAFAAQPTLPIHGINNIQIPGTHAIVSNNFNGNSLTAIPSPAQTEETNSPNSIDISPIIDDTSLFAANVTDFLPLQEQVYENHFDIANFPLPNWSEDPSPFPLNAAPMMQQSMEAFDFYPFMNF